MISISSHGSFNDTKRRLLRMQKQNLMHILHMAGHEGMVALSSATPEKSGQTANSWDYKIEKTRSGVSIIWTNSNIQNGFPVAIMLQYGHGTGSGGYVEGRDYINPAIQPIFQRISDEVRKAVNSR